MMQAMMEAPRLQTSGSGDTPLPPDYTAVSSGDGEGDGYVLKGLQEAEAFAARNSPFPVLDGISLAETVHTIARRNGLRDRLSIAAGKATLRHFPTYG